MECDMQVILEQFMTSPLVTWVKTFGQLGDQESNMFSEYTELVDGIFLNTVMDQINPEGTVQGLNKVNNDVSQRAQNLSVLIYHIKTYYQETLHQLVMVSPPNVLLLGRNPLCEESLEEINKLLLLLLGCAVQCEKKEEFIEKIQSLDFDTQAAIAAHIQEVTHCQENVFDLHWLEMEDLCPEEWENLCRNMISDLKMLVEQRDRQFETIVELMQGNEMVQSAVYTESPSLTESSGCRLPLSQQHLPLELTDAKAKIKRLQQELVEKSEQLLDCRQDLDAMEAELKKFQQENMHLLTDARAARMYRDELDAVKERAIRADKLESEVARYREKLHNMDFYKVKLEELKEDNQVLMESKVMLEEQLQNTRARADKLHHLEKHNLLLEAKLHDVEEERAVDRRHIEELMERNVTLELSHKRTMEESQHLGWELEQLGKNPQHNSGSELKSLGQEVTEKACSRLLKLEKENQRLLRAIEDLQGARHTSDDTLSYFSQECPTYPSRRTLEDDINTQEDQRIHMTECFTEKTKETTEDKSECVVENCKSPESSLVFTNVLTSDTEHLHASLENGNCLESELHEVENLQNNLHQGLEMIHQEVEKKHLEKENWRLRQKVKIQEASFESSSMKLAVLKKETRTMVTNVNCVSDVCIESKDLEKENQELLQQAATDKKLLTSLKEELLDQRLRTQQKEIDLEKVTYQLEKLRLKLEMGMGDQQSGDHVCQQLVSELESPLMKSLKIKKERMTSLETRLQESSKINQQLQQDLKTVKQNYEALLKRQEEKSCQRSPPERAWHIESQKTTWALLKVKDQLIEVERNNATLLAEKQALQTQLQSLHTQSDRLQAQIVALQQQTASLQESNTTLQTHNAQLQVENSIVSTQNASLKAHNGQLQRERQSSEAEREAAVREREDLRTVNELLLRDHERLSVLHERQAAELEVLSHRYSSLESNHRTLEIEHRSLEDRYDTLLQQRAQLEGFKKALREEQQKMQNEILTQRNTTAECQRLRDEKDWLNLTYQKQLVENEGLQTEHGDIKSQLNSSKQEQKQLESDLSRLKEQNQQLDITTIKLSNQCELLTQLKGNLEEENRHLLDQIQSLMLQNRTLLDQTMESKDLFHVEQRQHIDKLNELRRQKEKLEEKIMDQYKFYDPSPPRRQKNWITLKMKKLMKTRSRDQQHFHSSTPPLHSESCEGLDNLRCRDNGSLTGSQGSEESASNSLNGDGPSPRKSSSKDLQDTIPPSVAHGPEDQNHSLNGKTRRGHSASSSGEFSVSFENVAWSSDSSPCPDPLYRHHRSRDTPSPAHPGHDQSKPRSSSGSGVRRSSSGRSPGDRSFHKLDKASIGLYKTQSVRSTEGDLKSDLETRGKSSSVSGCLNCFATPMRSPKRGHELSGLPRASCVISTSEGNSRRASVHSTASGRSVASLPNKNTAESQLNQCDPSEGGLKETTDLEAEDRKTEKMFDSEFTIESVFTNTIFSETSVVKGIPVRPESGQWDQDGFIKP